MIAKAQIQIRAIVTQSDCFFTRFLPRRSCPTNMTYSPNGMDHRYLPGFEQGHSTKGINHVDVRKRQFLHKIKMVLKMLVSRGTYR